MTEHVPSGDTGMKPRRRSRNNGGTLPRPAEPADDDPSPRLGMGKAACPSQDVVEAKRPRRLVTVTLTRPRCPRCGCIRLHKYRSIRDQGDGSALWWVRCTADDCGQRFRVLLE